MGEEVAQLPMMRRATSSTWSSLINDSTTTLSAYHYTDNAHITLLWQRTGDGVGSQSVAIGPTGKVYSAGRSVIWELDRVTGTTLRSIPGSFAGTPALTNNVLWILGDSETFAYDLVTLQLFELFTSEVRILGHRSPGAFTDGYFVLDYGNIVGSHSFDVYRAETPAVTTNPATFIASFSARLGATLNPHGLATTFHFQYGTTTAYGLTTAPQTQTGNTSRNVSARIGSLMASTTYHFRIVASNMAGTTMGADRTFTTLPATGFPVVITNPATDVTASSTTLHGSLDPHGLSTTVHFEYGTTTSYGHNTPAQSETGNTYRNIASTISGLTAHTTYHFRVVATNSVGTRRGNDRTFITP